MVEVVEGDKSKEEEKIDLTKEIAVFSNRLKRKIVVFRGFDPADKVEDVDKKHE